MDLVEYLGTVNRDLFFLLQEVQDLIKRTQDGNLNPDELLIFSTEVDNFNAYLQTGIKEHIKAARPDVALKFGL